MSYRSCYLSADGNVSPHGVANCLCTNLGRANLLERFCILSRRGLTSNHGLAASPRPLRAEMSRPPSRRATRLTSGALFLLLGLVGSAPSASGASCGHYVVSPSGRSTLDSLYRLELLGPPGGEQAGPTPAAPD